MPRVSVIVPNYNHAEFLEQRLDSILGQTFSDFEVLLLDDASTDGSLEIIRRYSDDPRIRIHVNEVNSGSPFIQWNRGMAEANGKYIWIAESDDFCDLGFLHALVPHLESDPACGVAFCQSFIVDRDDRITGTYAYGQFADSARWRRDFRADGPDELRRYFSIANVIPNASAAVFRSELVQSHSTAPEHLRLAGDWMFWVQLLSRSDLRYVAEPLNYFREAHEQSQRFRAKRAGLEILEGLEVYDYIDRTVGMSRPEKLRALGRRIRHWMYVRRHQPLEKEAHRKIFARFQVLATGVYGKSPRTVRSQILLRAALYAAIQHPLLKGTLGKAWRLIHRKDRLAVA